jgi:ATP-binding cassette subfamily B protein
MPVRSLNLARLVRPYWKLLTLGFVAMLVEAGANLLEPWPLKVVFDYVMGSKAKPAWVVGWFGAGESTPALLNAAVIAVLAIAVVGAVGTYCEKYLATAVGQRVMYDLRHLLYHHVQRLSLSFYDQRKTGDLVVRLTSDIDAAQDFISSAALGMFLDVMTLVGMLLVMFYLDWRFSLIALSVAPLLFLVTFRLMRRIKRATREVKKKESELASVVQESISSIRVVKAFASEDYEERRFDRESAQSVEIALQARSVKARLAPLVDVIVAIGTALVLWFGARLVIEDRLTAGALIVFVLYLGKMYKPMKDLAKMTDTWSKASVSLERLGELLRVERQVRNRPDAQPAPLFAGAIAFDRVTFGYLPGQTVLRDLSLSIRPGQRAAIVGPTGSGKSTLIGLIPRLYDVASGCILIDGHDVRDYTLQSLRPQVSFVLQDTVLFHGPVWRNIAYGKQDASRAQIVAAAKLANAHEFIERMPDGYDTVVGERGDTLSGGQRQRIAIARAIIRDTPILLLDEPSAALDPESEELIFHALTHLMAGRTSITIAHRLATVRRADVIFVLDDGVIVERGTHAELLAAGGLYARLFRLQFHPEDAEAASIDEDTARPRAS